MSDLEREELVRLRAENQTLRAQVAALEQTIAELLERQRLLVARIEELERVAARQAAPFRRRDSRRVPEERKKSPGRPPGHKAERRVAPMHIDEHVDAPLAACPGCGGEVTDVTPVTQIIEEIPPPRVHVTRLITYRGRCRACGVVQSTHPLQRSTAQGAAGVQLGPRAMATAIALRQQFGLTSRMACRVLRTLCGVRLSPGGLIQATRRAASRLNPAHEALRAEIHGAPAVFADETSWYVGGPKHWLWVFTTPDATLYHVYARRGRDVVLQMLGDDFAGILVSDCLASYENLPYRTHKCLAHHQKAIAEALARPDTTDPSSLKEWRLLFVMVNALWKHRQTLGEAEFARQRSRLEGTLDRLLATPRGQPGDEAVRKRIGKRRDVVFGCLEDPSAEPTNNRAERALRPAVIARKLSCGNKTASGAKARECLSSLATTCTQRQQDFLDWLEAHLRLRTPLKLLPAAIR